MTAIEQAANLYAKHGLKLSVDLERYLKWGYVFVTPDRVLLARPLNTAKGVDHWPEEKDADAWYVKLAVGENAMRWFFDRMPYALPFVAWKRDFKSASDKLHIHRTERLKTLL